ncbi:MAG: CPBP family intramembrane metalloprotease [Proteobacteria bacterium]|nr:CPBP family intramembrane metalloprotease [Pseudomonadota bacterium]
MPTLDRRALLALLLIVPAPCLSGIVGLFAGKASLTVALWAGAKVWMAALPLVWLLYVDKEPLSWSRPSKGGFGVSALSGLLIAAIIAVAYLVVGANWIDPADARAVFAETGLASPAVYLGVAAYWIFANSVLEEYVYRWFIFRKAEQLVGRAGGVFLAALAFVPHHWLALSSFCDLKTTAIACAGIFTGGLIWSAIYERYRSVWVPWVSHAIVDVSVFGIGWVLLFG